MLLSQKSWAIPAPNPTPERAGIEEEKKTYIGLILPRLGGIVTRITDAVHQRRARNVYHGCAAFPLLSEEHFYKYAGKNSIKLYQFKNDAQNHRFIKTVVESYKSFRAETDKIFGLGLYPMKGAYNIYMTQEEYVAVRYGLAAWCFDVIPTEPMPAASRLQTAIKLNNMVARDAMGFISKHQSDKYIKPWIFDNKSVFKVNAPSLDRLFAFLEKKGVKVATYQEENSTEDFKLWTAK